MCRGFVCMNFEVDDDTRMKHMHAGRLVHEYNISLNNYISMYRMMLKVQHVAVVI